MPNWITTRVSAPEAVIKGMLNADGAIDFGVILPFPGPNDSWDSIRIDAEILAEIVCKIPVSSNGRVGALEQHNRDISDIRALDGAGFSQFVGMLENYRACGFLHSMDFGRKVWGTKWNACEQTVDAEQGLATFETAWGHPDNVMVELSKRFPTDLISVVYADEDIGSNCGRYSLLDGRRFDEDIAPSLSEQTPDEEKKWETFALQVKGWDPAEVDEANADE